MISLRLILKAFTVFLISSGIGINAQCDKCGTLSGVACISETEFQYCIKDPNVPEPTLTGQCPQGSKCVNTKEICSTTLQATCISECGKCSADKKFACLSQTQFALCFGNDFPSNVTEQCPQGWLCNIDAPGFCVEEQAGGGENGGNENGGGGKSTNGESTCREGEQATTARPPTSTPSPENPTVYCQELKRLGRFPVENDTTCKEYIYCYSVNGLIVGQQYPCPGITLFNPLTQQCVSPQSYQCHPGSPY